MIGLAGPDIEGPAMPRAGDDMTVEPAVGERAPAMGADPVDGEDLAAHIEERHGLETSAPLTTSVNEGVEGLPRADPGAPAPPAGRT